MILPAKTGMCPRCQVVRNFRVTIERQIQVSDGTLTTKMNVFTIGNLGGRRGTFLLAHRGVMNRGAQQLEIEVVPDSGTGELQGIAGKLSINIAPDGKHFYDFDYTLSSK